MYGDTCDMHLAIWMAVCSIVCMIAGGICVCVCDCTSPWQHCFLYTRSLQITSLVSLQLLTRESAAGDLDNPRFKCCVGPKTAFAVAKRLKMDLAPFLHEPELHGDWE